MMSIATQITRQHKKICALKKQIDQLMTRRADEEKKLAELYDLLVTTAGQS